MTDSQQDQLDLFAYKWVNYAINELKWTKQQCGAIAASGRRLVNTNGLLEPLNISSSSSTYASGSGNCECNQTVDFCMTPESECLSSDCDEKTSGCGFLFLNSCNGRCGLTDLKPGIPSYP